MNPDQAPNARRTLKRAHDANSDDAHSGNTPAAKRNHDAPETHLRAKKRMAHNTPSPPHSMPLPATSARRTRPKIRHPGAL